MSIDGSALVVRAWEPPEEVILNRHIIESPGLQPEDVGVLARLLVRDPSEPATIVALAKELQEAGWKMGESRFTAIFKRLKQAGHVQHVSEFNPVTSRPHWVVRVYRNPANNEQYVQGGVETASQVRAETVETSVSGAERACETVETAVSPAQSETVESTDSGAEPWKSGIRKTTVPPGQSRNRGNRGFASHPPHPPEEVDTSSPNPLNQSAAPTEEEAGTFTPDEILAAEHYLQMLPAPWTVGRKTAQRLAPLLLEAATAQGWELDDDLRAQLTSNPDGIKRHASVLEKERIADLPLRAAMAKPTASQPQPTAATVGLPAWCEDLDCDEDTRERTITDAHGYRRTGPCPACHPANTTRQEAA